LKVLSGPQARCSFIVVSGTIGEEAAVELMREGANDYVMKTTSRAALAIEREIKQAMDGGSDAGLRKHCAACP